MCWIIKLYLGKYRLEDVFIFFCRLLEEKVFVILLLKFILTEIFRFFVTLIKMSYNFVLMVGKGDKVIFIIGY